ncbi:MAG: nucleotide exchange factor GrpE [Magnetococcales bacterium]|nr:nucleotide exchange factor GrpE [Magnetococcales bacterium]MBF0421007.1 nucleotide exchange factor GrpE [Magnetococcales bacterium]
MTEQDISNEQMTGQGADAQQPGSTGADAHTVADGADDVVSAEGSGDGSATASGDQEWAAMRQKLEETEAALAKSRDETLRAMAEMQNIRKRGAREMQQARDFAVEGFARDLLSVSDNMERALGAMPQSQDTAIKALVDGVGMVQAELRRIFGNHGISRIECIGQPFDPNLHQAVQEVEAPEVPPGSVVAELQPGYLLRGRLLRAAMVTVAKA